MKILVTGASGQLAQSLAQLEEPEVTIITLGRPKLDITRLPHIEAALDEQKPDIVINTAAYTAVDNAEAEPQKAYTLNTQAAGQLAAATADRDVPLIHVSTDFVYEGQAAAPYSETDPICPLNIYGQTKLEGEKLVAKNNSQHIILRTSWLYSPFANNFVKTMLRVASSRDEVSVVDDQFGHPTYAPDLAAGILRITRQILSDTASAKFGIYNASGSTSTCWAEFADYIFSVSRTLGGPTATIKRISTHEFNAAAQRPLNTRLDLNAIREVYGVALPGYDTALPRCLETLLASHF